MTSFIGEQLEEYGIKLTYADVAITPWSCDKQKARKVDTARLSASEVRDARGDVKISRLGTKKFRVYEASEI